MKYYIADPHFFHSGLNEKMDEMGFASVEVMNSHMIKKWNGRVRPYTEIDDRGRTVILCHYPIMCYNGQYKLDRQGKPQTWMLYGHVHDTHDECLA